MGELRVKADVRASLLNYLLYNVFASERLKLSALSVVAAKTSFIFHAHSFTRSPLYCSIPVINANIVTAENTNDICV